jgi:hypothetical protein
VIAHQSKNRHEQDQCISLPEGRDFAGNSDKE